MRLLERIFGTHSDRELKKIYPIADKVIALDQTFSKLTDQQLQEKTSEFKNRYRNGETLDSLLPEAFAAVREASWRVLGMKPYRVQVIAGIVLHQGRIAEMRTGEGKTLMAVLPAYLNALTGKGVHIITVNDYLAKRDSEWMGKVYRFMGLSCGLVIHGISPEERKKAYAADITYATNNEVGFDYLRDNMSIYKENLVQRGHAFAIVDEIDSILIDEARTPLIISGQGNESNELYRKANSFVIGLKKQVFATTDSQEEEDRNIDADYIVDEKAKIATLTERGVHKAEQYFGIDNLTDVDNATLFHHINQALRAHGIMRRDTDYIVKNDEIIIVDEFTGRIMPGRRYNEGLHQAIEAKESVEIKNENKTLATITFQNYFRLYGKLSGMTGTALTEEEEFRTIYNLDIIVIPTNRPIQRKDYDDVLFKNETGKYRAIINQIKECFEKGQPVLVGTSSIEKSEHISKLLKDTGISHYVLNAKNHESEAEIIAQAGKLGAVTIATNMAGRGTDILLGGNADFLAKQFLRRNGYSEGVIAEAVGFADSDNEEILSARKLYHEYLKKVKPGIDDEAERVREIGGLFIIGTERHESRRIDNQLRGRAGRQGDPGASRFFVSLTDDVIRLFGSDRVQKMLETLKVDDDTPLETKFLTNALEQSQKTVESIHFQTRKNVLEFDDVINRQRNIIYKQRRQVLDGEDIRDNIQNMIYDYISDTVYDGWGEGIHNQGELDNLLKPFYSLFLYRNDILYSSELTVSELIPLIYEKATSVYATREQLAGLSQNGEPVMRDLERIIMLRVVDEFWMDHIDAMSDLKDSVALQAYANQKPIDVYKREGFELFDAMNDSIRKETVRRLYTVQIAKREPVVKKVAIKINISDSDDTIHAETIEE